MIIVELCSSPETESECLSQQHWTCILDTWKLSLGPDSDLTITSHMQWVSVDWRTKK